MTSRRPRLWLTALIAAALCCLGLTAFGQSGTAPAPTGKPQRIMSTNLCSDFLLLMLVPKERIVSITNLAHEPVEKLMPGADQGVGINHGTAEEVVAQQPDLILASPWSTPALRRLGAMVGAPVAEIDSANSFADIRRITRQIGDLVGEPERAETLVADMDRTLAELAATRPAGTVEVVAWSGGNSVAGMGTLTHEIIEVAGGDNVAAKLPDATFSSFGLEELLAARPDAIMRGEDSYGSPSLRDASTEHPVVRQAFAGRRIVYPESLYTCGLPQSANAARKLREAFLRLPRGDVQW